MWRYTWIPERSHLRDEGEESGYGDVGGMTDQQAEKGRLALGQLAFSFPFLFHLGSQLMGWCCPYWRQIFPSASHHETLSETPIDACVYIYTTLGNSKSYPVNTEA